MPPPTDMDPWGPVDEMLRNDIGDFKNISFQKQTGKQGNSAFQNEKLVQFLG